MTNSVLFVLFQQLAKKIKALQTLILEGPLEEVIPTEGVLFF
jgi:predicted AlkP superfamily phosphohydrolase/phosphomutase